VGRGETVLGGQVAARVVSELNRSAGPDVRNHGGISGREAEVARLVGSGATNHEIALTLYISEGTARNHVSKILRKLDLRDRTQLAIWAAKRGLTEPRLRVGR